MHSMAAAASQRVAGPPPCLQQHARGQQQRSLRAGPLRSAVASGRQQAALPRRALVQQQAGSSSSWQQRRRAVAARSAAAPQDFGKNKEHFDAANKDYAVLTEKIEETAKEVVEALQGTSLFLVGMMGSGKSTVGKLVSQALGYCFFDTDTLIEQLMQKKVSEIFAEEGEAGFRELETQVLGELSPFKTCVIATGGGVPTRAENWGHMQGGISVWLNGPPTLLAHRVVGDGTDSRPLLAEIEGESDEQPDAYRAAVARLASLLEQREALYQIADVTVSLEGSGPDGDLGAPAMVVAYRVLAAINQRVKADAEERQRRMDFEIVDEGKPKTVQVMDSPVPQQEQEDPFLP